MGKIINDTISNKTQSQDPLPKREQRTDVVAYSVLRKTIIGMMIVSALIGGIAGLLIGAWVSSDSDVISWVHENVFWKTATTASVNSVADETVAESKTIAVIEESATIDVVKRVDPSVVSIVVSQDLSELYDLDVPFFRFETPQGFQEVGAGTGFIISEDGLILTNKHVVDAENAEYSVIMNDGEQYDALVLDTDPFNDIALIKIDATGLPTVELGDSDVLEIGQTVIAIGNTLGEFQNTVTRGVVSGLSRTITAGTSGGSSETLEGIIQTDAAINHGNSGGPLLNLDGQVIGLNTAIRQEGQLVGFAIPINQANRAIESVKEYGRIVRPYIGIRYILLNEEIAEQNNLTVDYGALIARGRMVADLAVIPGSPADKAGLVENDIILEINGQRIDDDQSLAKQLQQYNPGESVNLKILHDGEESSITVILAEFED